ncbi:unnamed protein product [Prorocentrum cordatum]|uniref:Uncharacterized protein n=1 Tax=Prorocentrum cordatum TaxID=2364126 RepID=A0ABN9WW94_9DINO|nr:unnamed protein product [Polarella glacialis]
MAAGIAPPGPAAAAVEASRSSDESAKLVRQVGLAGVSNAVAASVTNPVDVLKVRMQLAGYGVASPHEPGGVLRAARRILHEEGAAGFYRGLSASLLREMSYSGIRMGMYEPVKEALGAGGRSPLALKVLAGGITGAAGSILANPLDLIKVRMQRAAGPPPYRSVADAVVQICREGAGVRSLWRGSAPTVKRAALLTASQVPTYDHAKHLVLDAGYMQEGYMCHFACCMVAGVVAAGVTSPVDLAKSRVMTQPVDPASGRGTLYAGTFDCLAQVARREGPQALFKGFNSQWLRIGPHTTTTAGLVSLMCFEQLRRLAGMSYL